MDKNKGQRRCGKWVLLLMLSMSAVIFFSMHGYYSRLRQAENDKRDTLQLQLNRLQSENSQLSAQLEEADSYSYAESVAREQYGYIKKGEMLFTFTNPELLDNYTDEEFSIYLEEIGY